MYLKYLPLRFYPLCSFQFLTRLASVFEEEVLLTNLRCGLSALRLSVYLSDAAEKHHGSCTEWPFLLLGGLGQAKAGSGRYLQFPSYGKKGQRTIGNLYNTFMEYAGKPQDQFGRLDLNIDAELQRGPLPELIA